MQICTHVYVCVYIHIYIYIYIYMYGCIYVHMYICIYVYMYMCIYVYMYVNIYIYNNTGCMHVRMCVCEKMHAQPYMCMCMHMRMCLHANEENPNAPSAGNLNHQKNERNH